MKQQRPLYWYFRLFDCERDCFQESPHDVITERHLVSFSVDHELLGDNYPVRSVLPQIEITLPGVVTPHHSKFHF